MLYKNKYGATLAEMLVVLLILAILVALTLPQFNTLRERGLAREAKANLKLISVAEKIYRMRLATYYPSSDWTDNNPTTISTFLKVNITQTNWLYSIAGGADTFTAYADRNGTGGYFDCVYSVTTSSTDSEPTANSACP